MKKISFIFLTMLLWQGIGDAQQSNPGLEITRQGFHAKQVISPSPEAAELGKYGNIPVSLFTGIPNVSIPLVELKGNFLTLPVSLSYNSSGFKPEEIAPWTGLGWALNAGGVITRSAIGDPDMDDNYFKSPSPLDAVATDEYAKQQYFESIRNRATDAQPDVYYYNFMGQSGKFFIYPDSTILQKEKSYLTIICWPNLSAENAFIIRDEQGILYEFMVLEETTISPLDDQPGAPSMTPRTFTSAWYLSKVTAPNGKEVLEFDYYSPSNSQSTMSGALSNNSVTFTIGNDGTPFWEADPPTSTTYAFQHPATAIYKKFIKKATLKKNGIYIGYIDFESELNARTDLGDADFDGERRLKHVKLYNITGGDTTAIKHFTLAYENFGNHQAESPGFYRRLKLKTVREMSIDSTVTPNKPPHTFHYNGESLDMPMRFTSGLDHWGFFNGQTNTFGGSPTLIPTVAVSAPYIGGNRGLGANREADAPSATLTVLERIDYPTGGYTTFEYEGNAIASLGPPVTPLAIGGIRIKKMVDHSFPDQPAVAKLYEYLTAEGNPSGNIAYAPHYYSLFEWDDASGCAPGGNIFKSYNATISASSTFGLGTIQGSHIGYSRVTESLTDPATNRPLGKTVYNYDIQGFNEVDDHIGNGDLIKQEVYDNGGKLLEETVNTYSYELFGQSILNRRLQASSAASTAIQLIRSGSPGSYTYAYRDPLGCLSMPSGFAGIMFVHTQYNATQNQIQQQRKKLDQQVRKVFDPLTSSYLTYTKNFTYSNADHNFPTLIEQIDSKSEKVFTAIKYVADYTVSCSPSAQAGSMAAELSDMKGKNMMRLPVETTQYRDDVHGTDKRYIGGEFIQYKSGLPEKIYYLRANPFPSSIDASQASCTPDSQIFDTRYRLAATLVYDSLMNIKEEHKVGTAVTSYFWGYDNRFPVAKVTGKTYSQAVGGTGISQAVLDNPASEAALRTELNKLYNQSNVLVTTHTYQPMVGMISATDQRQQLLRYDYDKLNRLVHIRDSNDIVKNFRYNYGLGTAPTISDQSLFYNAPVQDTFTKSGCPSGQFGEEIIYLVPYGKHAAVSQYKADSLAAADIAANGQNHANTVGRCYWKNAVKNQFVFKDNCLPEEGPPIAVMYTVPAGKYKSFISQTDADAMATADVATLGQVYANTNGTCSCVGEGKKWINGECETGIQVWLGGHYVNGQWECVYYYEFSDASTSIYYYVYQPFPCPTGD